MTTKTKSSYDFRNTGILLYFMKHDNKTKIHRVPDQYADHTTCINLAAHLDNISHDVISNFLKRERITPNQIWTQVSGLLNNTEESCLIIDDSVQNKQYSKSIDTLSDNTVERLAV